MIELFKELFILFRKVGDDSDGKQENINKIAKGDKTEKNKENKISHLQHRAQSAELLRNRAWYFHMLCMVVRSALLMTGQAHWKLTFEEAVKVSTQSGELALDL